MLGKFARYFGTATPIWRLIEGQPLVLSDAEGKRVVEVRLPRSQRERICQLGGPISMLALNALIFEEKHTLYLVGKKNNHKEWAGIVAPVEDGDAIAHNFIQALAFAESVVSEVNAIVVVIDRSGAIRRFNKKAEEYTGYTENEVIGLNAHELFMSPGEAESSRKNVMDFFDKNRVFDVERDIKTVYGERKFMFRNRFAYGISGGESNLLICSGVELSRVDKKHKSEVQPFDEVGYLSLLEKIVGMAAMVDGLRALISSMEFGDVNQVTLGHAKRLATIVLRDVYALYEDLDAKSVVDNLKLHDA
ncbi:PAS domain S-box protein [Burkholderia cepacia]|uniref:PAS domain S-box protein n=1 Tax=Burkholderia cepacia TaxID=292 RepID=UPI002ABE0738|nr:PAS domain S-box protein [Burkholderia cepacia]